MAIKLFSTITCPKCGYQKKEKMPEKACLFFYNCKSCGHLMKPKKGDCCVFCSYGNVCCPPIQKDGKESGCCSQKT